MTESHPSLTERVRERVSRAGRAIERRDGAATPAARRPGRPTLGSSKPALTPEVQALRSVFTDLGEIYRSYRRRTNTPVPPALLSANTAFKAAPSLGTLVPVASQLAELELLDW